MKPHYSMLIQWSDEDKAYVVTLSEFGGCKTHGGTYEEAARKGPEAIESLIEVYEAERRPLPKARKFGAATRIRVSQER
jgi:antitoxin HicB